MEIKLDFRGLCYIYLSTWPYILAEIKHFTALLIMTLCLIGFGTAIAFLGIDVLWDSVGRGETLSTGQAKILFLPADLYTNIKPLTESARQIVLVRFLILTGIFVVITSTFNVAIRLYKVWILQRVNQSLRTRMVSNAEELSLRSDSKASTGDAIYRVFQDSAMVTAVVENIVVVPVIGIVTLAVQLIIASLFSPWFGFLFFVGVALCMVILGIITPRLQSLSLGARQASSSLFTRVQETFQSIQAIKTYGFENENYNRFFLESKTAIDTAFDLRRNFAFVKVACGYTLILVLFTTDYIATQYVLDGSTVFGASLLVIFGLSVTTWTVAAHQARAGSLMMSKVTVEDLIRVWCLAQDMSVGLNRAFWLLAIEPEVKDAENPQPFPVLQHGVSFHNVSFGYNHELKVLKNINLNIEVGEVIAVVGPSGSGKSTLASMLLRLFDPDEGSICIDNKDIRSIKINTLRRNIATALQENILFPVSIEENLRYAAPSISQSEIQSATKLACAEFISELPNGYKTELGVGGALLSTGQKQRLSIARALVRDTSILILDEPTASLDAETERQVIGNIKDWAQNKIILIITHRPSTIRDADRIIFLNEGSITETGTHEELLALGGDYEKFVLVESKNE